MKFVLAALKKSSILGALVAVVVCLGVSFAQTGQLTPELKKEQLTNQLELLRRAEASMGERHPKLPALRSQISKLESELHELLISPNPFAETTDNRQANAQLVERLSDAELRFLVIRLATEVKSLTKRIEALEARGQRKDIF